MLAERLEDAQALAERALSLTRQHQERGNEAYALRLLGEIAICRDPVDVASAETHYRHARPLADVTAPLWSVVEPTVRFRGCCARSVRARF